MAGIYLKMRSLMFTKYYFLFLIIFGLGNAGIKAQQKLADEDSGNKFNVGISDQLLLDINLADAKATMQILLDKYLEGENINLKSNVTIANNIEALERKLINKEFDVINLLTTEYLKFKNRINLEPLLVQSFNGTGFFSFVLLVRKDSGIRDLNDLRDKDIKIFTNKKREYSIPVIWLNYSLIKQKLPKIDNHFSRVTITENANMAVLPVFFNNASACIISSETFKLMNELNPQIGNELEIIKQSPEYLLSVSCSTPNIIESVDYVKMIVESSSNLKKTNSGRQLLAIFKRDKVIPFKKEFLKSIEELVSEHDRLNINMSLEN